jgi:hypothetical protein
MGDATEGRELGLESLYFGPKHISPTCQDSFDRCADLFRNLLVLGVQVHQWDHSVKSRKASLTVP